MRYYIDVCSYLDGAIGLAGNPIDAMFMTVRDITREHFLRRGLSWTTDRKVWKQIRASVQLLDEQETLYHYEFECVRLIHGDGTLSKELSGWDTSIHRAYRFQIRLMLPNHETAAFVRLATGIEIKTMDRESIFDT